jgi:hypothetical protein
MDVLQKFKTELEKDVGRKLLSHQIQHAANSIRKTKLYIENVLDGKFIPHGSYGINHIKHNLEYVVGLMQSSRKRTNTNERGHERDQNNIIIHVFPSVSLLLFLLFMYLLTTMAIFSEL